MINSFGVNDPIAALTLKLLDLATFVVVIQIAMIIRFEALGPNAYILSYGWQMILLIALQFLCFTAFGMYRAVLRYSSLDLARAAARGGRDKYRNLDCHYLLFW